MSSSAVLADFVKRFCPIAAEGLTATYQLQLTGSGAPTRNGAECWHLIIADQRCELHQGPTAAPDVAVSMTVEDWNDLVAGRLDPFSAFITGRLTVIGDLALATRLQALFSL